jgi:predicted transcriptional regulator
VFWTLILGGIALIKSNSLTIEVTGNGELEEGTIAVFYGSLMDKKLSEAMVDITGRNARYYNITKTQMNTSFEFKNDSVIAVWWINDLPLPIDLTFMEDLHEWKNNGRGLFVLNRYFHKTPILDLAQLGITAYAPVVYPFNGTFVEQEIQLAEKQLPTLNLTQTSFSFNGSSGWVEVSNDTTILAEIPTPENEPILGTLTSGIWMIDTRLIVGSFSIITDTKTPESMFQLYGVELNAPTNVIDLLGQLAKLSLGDIPSNNGTDLQFGGIDQIASIGIIAIGSVLLIFSLVKIGVFSKLREIIVGIFVSMVLLVAHVAYSPQKRRINEDELLENQLRVQILDYLDSKGEQGAHLREIQRGVGCGISSLLWHLQALDDFNLVTHTKIGKYHIFYLSGVKSVQTSEVALALKSEVAKELCRLLIKNGKPLSLSKISQEINVHHSSVQHHIKKLGELGVIIALKEKKRSKYVIGPHRLLWLQNHLEVT